MAPNGELNRENFTKFFSQFRADKDADMFCSQLFNAFDINHSKYVNFDEFILAISLAKDGDDSDKLRFAFRMYDVNNDKKLDQKEIEKIILGIYNFNSQKNRDGAHKPSEVAKFMIQKYDKDGNGYITEDEFIGGLAEPTLLAIESFSVLRLGNFRMNTKQ